MWWDPEAAGSCSSAEVDVVAAEVQGVEAIGRPAAGPFRKHTDVPTSPIHPYNGSY